MSDELARIDEGRHDRYEPPTMSRRTRLACVGAAVVLGLVSFFVLGALFAKPETYQATIAALDAKKNTVMNLVAASTGSSAAVSLLPGDAGTPIAEKLVDLSSDFLVVLAAIYLEKYLLTILGLTAFRVLIPISCLLVSVGFMVYERMPVREICLRLAAKLLVFGLLAFLVVPVSVRVSDMIETTYQTSIEETIQTAEQTTEAIEESAQEGEGDSTSPLAFLLNMPEELGKLTESARNSLNNFIEALAVMIVTSCIIPILVLFFFLWLMRLILGINVDVPMRMPRHRMHR